MNKKKSKAKKGDNIDGSDDDGGDSVGTLVTIALQSNSGKLQEIPAPAPKSKKGNKGTFMSSIFMRFFSFFISFVLCILHYLVFYASVFPTFLVSWFPYSLLLLLLILLSFFLLSCCLYFLIPLHNLLYL